MKRQFLEKEKKETLKSIRSLLCLCGVCAPNAFALDQMEFHFNSIFGSSEMWNKNNEMNWKEPFTESIGPSSSLEFHCLIDYNFWLFNSLHIQFMCSVLNFSRSTVQLCVVFVYILCVGHSSIPVFSIQFERLCFSSQLTEWVSVRCQCLEFNRSLLNICVVSAFSIEQ